VTTRRLSSQIEYSQPVLYKHFTGMEQIADAIAIDGFGEFADAIRDARLRAGTASDALARIAYAYLDFARDNPAVTMRCSPERPPCASPPRTHRLSSRRPSPSWAKRSASSVTSRMRMRSN
jgi:AcrR family transcriptional regulator